MKKFKPDYFGWTFLFIIDILFSLFWAWLVYQGLIAERLYTFDLGGYSLALVAGFIFIWNIYELWVLIQFLMFELGRTLIIDGSSGTLTVIRKGSTVNLKLKEIREVIFSERRFNSRTPTAHLSYTELIFQNNEHLLVTSFLLNTKEMKKIIGKESYKETVRTRGLFEAIRQKDLCIEH